MKHLLNGVAIAAALAIAAPVWAQAPMKPASPAAPKAATAPAAPAAAAAPAAPAAAKVRKKRGGTHMAKRGAASTTDDLNRAELARIQGGGAGGAMAPAIPSSTTPAAIGSPKQP
jgi:hypothetical protein